MTMLPRRAMKALAFSVLLALGASGCSSYRDDEQMNYNKDVISSILAGKDEAYKPNKVVYIDNPKSSPHFAVNGTYNSWRIRQQIDEIFAPYILRNGFTVACAEDKEKQSVLIVLSHDGIYQTYGMHPAGGFVAMLCQARAKQ